MQAASGGLPVVSGAEPRRLAAFLHADMVGYSRLIADDIGGTSARLIRLRRVLIDPALGRYGGRLHSTAGDSLMMEFSSVLSAVRFAVEIQTRIPEFDEGEPPDRRIRFRMGIDIGDAIPDGQNMHGDAVNIAARLQAICPPGSVCVSAVVRHHVQGLDLRFDSLGMVELKNIARPVEAFVVRLDRPAERPPGRRIVARPVVAGVLLCLGAGAVVWWLMAHRPEPSRVVNNGTAVLSIAVLPFTNLSSDRDEDYLADGISEDLTTDLSHLDGAIVIARESAFTYRGKEVDIRDVGRQLGVRYVLEGSVRKIGDAVRINAQLIATDNGAHVWADRFDQPLRDLQNGQDNAVQRIGAALDIKFDQGKQQPKAPNADPAAYDLVLRARAVMQERLSYVRNVIAAGYFEQALRKDSKSVEAMVGAATILVEANRDLNRASILIGRAALLAPNFPDVLAAKFRLLMRQRHDEQAVATFRQLLDIDSSAAGVAAEFIECSYCYRRWGRPEDAVPLLERTARLNPLAPSRQAIYLALGRMLIMLGRDNEAIDWLQQGMRAYRSLTPTQIADREPWDTVIEDTKTTLAAAYALTGQPDDAHMMVASAMSSDRMMDFTVRVFLNSIPIYFDEHRQEQEKRIAEGLRRAGLRDHLDERADFHTASGGYLRDVANGYTPISVPGGTTIDTEELEQLLQSKPLVLTTTAENPTIPGAILVNLPNSGSLTDEWQDALGKLVAIATGGDKQRPIVTFAWCVNRWHSRNLALRLIALGYTKVYWYRGGWEAWDAHDLPKAPLAVQFQPPH
jgi:TolB-like protein/class 3 adenylate cyclase/rhodanese-related sulfurtransferase